MSRFLNKWVLIPTGIFIFLGSLYWIIGKIQYRLNVMDVEDYEPQFVAVNAITR